MNILPKEATEAFIALRQAADQAKMLIASTQTIVANVNEIILAVRDVVEDINRVLEDRRR